MNNLNLSLQPIVRFYSRARQFVENHPYASAIGAICAVGMMTVATRQALYSNEASYRLILNGMSEVDRSLVIQTVAEVPTADRQSVVREARLLITDGMSGLGRSSVIQTVAKVPAAERQSVVRAARLLITDGMSGAGRSWVILAVAEIPTADRQSVVDRAIPSITPEMNGLNISMILSRLTNVPLIHPHNDNENPTVGLTAQLQSWATEYETAFPDQPHLTTDYTPLTSLDENHATNLREFLINLRTIKDYAKPVPDYRSITPRNNVIRRVENMLQLACTNPVFKEKMLALIAEGLTDCDDRKLVIFNDIEIEYQFHIKEMSDREFIPLAQGASIYYLLKRHAIKIAQKNNLRDVVEVILGYHIGVQKRRNEVLPITTREMGHPDASGVTTTMLEEAEKFISNYTPMQQLERSEHWQKRMSERYPMEADLIETKFGKLFSAAQKFDKYCASPAEKKLWVDAWFKKHPEHPELAAVLLDPNIKDYTQAGDAIAELRGIALAHLGNHLVSLFSRSTERKR